MGARRLALAAVLAAACSAPPPPAGTSAELTVLLTRAWEAQMAELEAYGAFLRPGAAMVIDEVPFATNRPEPYARTVLADFAVARDSAAYPVRREMPQGPALAEGGVFSHAGVTVTVERLDWDRTWFDFEAPGSPDAALAALMERWSYDHARGAISRAPGHIHSLRARAAGLRADLGTAPPQALLELIEALAGAGVTELRVSTGR